MPDLTDLRPAQRAVLLECFAPQRYGSIMSAMFDSDRRKQAYLESGAKSLTADKLGTGYTRTTAPWGSDSGPFRVEWQFTLNEKGAELAREARRRARKVQRAARSQEREHTRSTQAGELSLATHWRNA